MIPANTLIQESAPRDFSGRVFGLLGFLATVASLIPLMVIASLADVFGVQVIFIILSVVMIISLFIVKKMPDHVLRTSHRI